MPSGTGRHRRPRQAPAIVVAAGVTGAGIAMPLFGAVGAQAAQTTTWDQVAECESGGMWSANEGNGFYGGLQLTLDMWKHYGGTQYAPRPDLASRSQQISVAESILDDRGPGAWPSCALAAGLTDGGGAPDVNPGNTATPHQERGRSGGHPGDRERDGSSSPARDSSGTHDDSDEPDGSKVSGKPHAPHDSKSPDGRDGSTSDGAASGRSASDRSVSHGSDADGSASNGSSSDESPSGGSSSDGSKKLSKGSSADSESSGRHRGAQDAGERATDGGSGDNRPSGRHASRDNARRAQNPAGDTYTVRPGDNLSGIAEDRNISRGWKGLYEDNENLIGVDPDLILPGQRLDLTIREQ